MKGILLAFGYAIWLGVFALLAQDKPKEFKTSEIQTLRLQNRQKDALLLKQRLDALQAEMQSTQKSFQESLKALTEEGEKVKAENHWPADTQFEPNQLVFSAPPAKEAKKQ
jgi:DNA anti-recombination protein RmuC